MCKLLSLFTTFYYTFKYNSKKITKISINLEACCFNHILLPIMMKWDSRKNVPEWEQLTTRKIKQREMESFKKALKRQYSKC
jgi:hypothetical protein